MTTIQDETSHLAILLQQVGQEVSRLSDRPPQDRSAKEVREDDLRLYVLLRMDLVMPRGKELVQIGHGFEFTLTEAMRSAPERVATYLTTGAHAKIAKEAKNLDALKRAQQECQAAGIPTFLVKDAGWTVFKEPTFTCLGIGPARRSELPKFVERMRLIKTEAEEGGAS